MYIITLCLSVLFGIATIVFAIIGIINKKSKYDKIATLLSAVATLITYLNINIPQPTIYPLNNNTETLRESMLITITSDPFAKIYYTLDGSDPKDGSVYSEPFVINKSTTVLAKARFLFFWSEPTKIEYHLASTTNENDEIANNESKQKQDNSEQIEKTSNGEMVNFTYGFESLEQHEKYITADDSVFTTNLYDDNYIIEWKDPQLENMLKTYYHKDEILYSDIKYVMELYIWGDKFICSVLVPDSTNITNIKDENWYRRKEIKIISSELFDIEGIQAGLGNISTLEDLKYFSSLQTLNICFQDELDLSTLPEMNTLYNLFLQYDGIKNIDALTRLPNLVTLDLGNNNIQDIKALNSLSYLEQFSADNNKITDLTPLRDLKFMTDLSLMGNDVEDYSVVSFIPHIEK